MRILYSDPALAVCIKPVGMDSESQVPNALSERLGGDIYTVHRLDKNVGGVMVYARTKAAAAQLSQLIQQGQMVKEYVAAVHGDPPKADTWEDLLFKDSRKNKVFVVKRQRAGVKKAKLEFKKLSASDPAIVHIRLHTGRSHQIRVQFSSRGFPLVGDHKYGARDQEKSPMLYSCRITFPFQGETKVFSHYPEWAPESNENTTI